MRLPRFLEGKSRLALLIYLIGIAQFVAVAFGMEMSRRARTQPQGGQHFGELAGFVAEDIARASGNADDLAREVERLHGKTGWTLVVHDADDHVLVRTAPPAGGGPARASGVVPLVRDGRAIGRLEYSFPLHPPGGGVPPPNFLVILTTLVLLVVGVGSLLTARMLTRPLARLTSVARDFGRGKLDARANMTRSDELGEMARAFDDMAERIAHLLRTERELLANVSHELRTPLARIRVALDLANDDEATDADPRQAALSLREIAEDLAELERLVDDVLAAARLALDEGSNAGLPIRRERLDMHALLDKSAAKFIGAHPRRQLNVRIPEGLPTVLGDVVLLRRVVDNLLDNAHKYSDKEHEPIWLEASCETTEDNEGPAGPVVVIEVRDRGIGIALSDLSRLFEPFFRADRSRTRATGGLGLGLALARRVVDAHGGTITFASEVGKGTTARVRLPAGT